MQQIIPYIQSELANVYPKTEIQSFIYLIMESVCGMNRNAFLLRKDTQLSPKERLRIEEIVLELKKQRPIQYILGETEFYGLRFRVDENVLIPRPETEELVEMIIRQTSHSPSDSKKKILDIGTGSGCIAIALAHNISNAIVSALDISESALLIAQENARINQVNVSFFHHDILADMPLRGEEKWDIIVSNPPYITPSEQAEMDDNVLKFEPHQALFVPEREPLLFYEKIAEIALSSLSENGLLFFETSSLYGQATAQMLRDKGYKTVELLPDISGKDRIAKASL